MISDDLHNVVTALIRIYDIYREHVVVYYVASVLTGNKNNMTWTYLWYVLSFNFVQAPIRTYSWMTWSS